MSAYVVFTRTKTIAQKELEEGIVIAKFPNAETSKDWYYREAYQTVTKQRKQGAIYHGLIVDGAS